ncbi:MAG: hypothetical protein IT539_07800 [Bradyrhizobiaceae bacterium]|nr:hypothetical protein [Bradyrhizobiaceae bacterium]
MNYFRSIRTQLSAKAKRMFRTPISHELPVAGADRHLAGDLTAEELRRLEQLAGQFPSMGGKEIGPFLRKLAREAPSDMAIVEVGSWLGAGTAQLAIGVRERGADQSVTIHTYDRWIATGGEIEKALRKSGLVLSKNQDTLPWVMEKLRPFGARIKFVKRDIAAIDWSGGAISVYVDDASKTPAKFHHVLRTFGPSWIPGITVLVLMDYYYWEKTGSEGHKCQKYFIEAHRKHFTHIDDFRRGSNAAFLYREKLDFEGVNFSSLLHPSEI